MMKAPGSILLRQFRTLYESGTVAGLTDGQLLERFIERTGEGGEVAFAALVTRHGPMVLGVCRRALADPDDVADAFQATFLILVKKARWVRVDDSLGRWLYGVSRKVAGRARVVASSRPQAGSSGIDRVEARTVDPDRFEALAWLDEELGRLAEPFRSAIVLCDLEGLTHEEAARDLRCPVGTIKSRLARGRRRLRERLEAERVGPLGPFLDPRRPVRAHRGDGAGFPTLGDLGPFGGRGGPGLGGLLAKEVLKAMTGWKWKLAASAVLTIGVATTGAGVLARGPGGDTPAVAGLKEEVYKLGRIEVLGDPRSRVVEVLGDRVRLEGRDLDLPALTEALKPTGQNPDAASTSITIRAHSEQKYSDLARVIGAIRDAGLRDIRFESIGKRVEDQLARTISADFVATPLAEIVSDLFGKDGPTVSHDPSIAEVLRKPVSFHVREIKLKQALDQLLHPNLLSYRLEEGRVILMSAPTKLGEAPAALRPAFQTTVTRVEREIKPSGDPEATPISAARREITDLKTRLYQLGVSPSDPALAGLYIKPWNPPQPASAPSERPVVATPRELSKVTLHEYIVEPPDMLEIRIVEPHPGQPITGERLVRPDGKMTLGVYGDVYVAGLTTEEIKAKLVVHLRDKIGDEAVGLFRLDPATGKRVDVDPAKSTRISVTVVAFNSKVYYVQGDVHTPGRLPITGSETVLDAINYAGGVNRRVTNAQIRLVRPAPPGAQGDNALPVDLDAIINRGDTTTNYQLMPGDRLVVSREPDLTPGSPVAVKEGQPKPPDVEARLQAIERKLDELARSLTREPRP